MADAQALLEDYKLKVTFATEQINRLQTQFQVMLTLTTAVATALVLSNTGSLSKGAKWITVIEIAIALTWLALGIAGRQRALEHRSDLEAAGRAWADAAGLGPGYEPVGSGVPVVRIAIIGPAALLAAWTGLLVVLFAID